MQWLLGEADRCRAGLIRFRHQPFCQQLTSCSFGPSSSRAAREVRPGASPPSGLPGPQNGNSAFSSGLRVVHMDDLVCLCNEGIAAGPDRALRISHSEYQTSSPHPHDGADLC